MTTAKTQIHIREHRGGYAESMSTSTLIDATAEALHEHVAASLERLGIQDGAVTIEKYGTRRDSRNGWDTHMVLLDGTPWGFTSGPLDE